MPLSNIEGVTINSERNFAPPGLTLKISVAGAGLDGSPPEIYFEVLKNEESYNSRTETYITSDDGEDIGFFRLPLSVFHGLLDSLEQNATARSLEFHEEARVREDPA